MDEVGRKYLKKKSNEWLKDFLKNNKEVITKYSLKLKT